MKLETIKRRISKLKPELHERFGVCEIGIFGSYVRGEQTKTSDIDFLVDFDREIDLLDVVALRDYLVDVFHKKIDIAHKRFLRKYIATYILHEVQYI